MITEKEIRKLILNNSINLSASKLDDDGSKRIYMRLIHIKILENAFNNNINEFVECIKCHSIEYLQYFKEIIQNELLSSNDIEIIDDKDILLPKILKFIDDEIEIKMGI